MGDPIHSQPVIVNYGTNDSVIYIATNHGYLHAFDADTGYEYFAVAPKEMLANAKDFYQDASSYQHIYGLDGHMVDLPHVRAAEALIAQRMTLVLR